MAVNTLTPNRATLTNSTINSGTAVTMDVIKFKRSFRNFVKAPELKGSFDIPTVEVSGYMAPTIDITIRFDVDITITHHITESLLIDFLKEVTADTTLHLYYGSTPKTLLTFGKLTTGIPVAIQSIDISANATASKYAKVVDVKITMVETG